MQNLIGWIIIIFGILQIILFFKIWVMTDNVKRIKSNLINNADTSFEAAQKEIIFGHPDKAFEIYNKCYVNDVARLHKETKNAYYHLLENEEIVDDLLREFRLDPEKGHIINGHVPVHQSEGESPVKCNGKVLVIDGGFSRPYQKVTGIAGYTLVYNSYGLILSAHEPFTSAEEAVAKEQDIVSNRVAVHYNNKRTLVGDTDTGTALKERISELIQLLEAYRKGIIKEKK